MVVDLPSSPLMLSAKMSDPVGPPTTVTRSDQGGLKEPTAQDWPRLRPVVLLLYEKHTMEETCAILKDKHRFKIRRVGARSQLCDYNTDL